MNRIGVFLGLLLIAQIFLTVLVYRQDDLANAGARSQSLVATEAYVIDELHIEDGTGGSVVLQRRGEHWMLPALAGLPANPERVENALQKLIGEDPGWTVAHTLAARQRFQVASYHFRRKVDLYSLGQLEGTVYLGTSPGFRKVHARNDASDAIYSLDLNLYDLPVDPGKWLEPSLLQVRAPIEVTADGYSLQRVDGQWRLGTGELPDQRELQALLDALRNLQVLGVATDEAQATVTETEAELILEIIGLARRTRLALFREGDMHYVSSSEYPYLFRISAYDFDRLTGIDSFLLSGAQ